MLLREKRGAEALQYGPVPGVKQLREIIAGKLLAPEGIAADPDDILVVNGGIETMNLICQVFIDPGDIILCEAPSFVQCVEIFEMFEAKCIGCEMDDQGLILADVEEKIRQDRSEQLIEELNACDQQQQTKIGNNNQKNKLTAHRNCVFFALVFCDFIFAGKTTLFSRFGKNVVSLCLV